MPIGALSLFQRQNFRNSLLGIGIEPKVDVFDELDAAYGNPGRHYHTRQHIAECLTQFSKVRHLAQNPCEIEVALWFHDAVYDTHRSDNEEMSAEWAEKYLATEGADSAVIKRIAAMILATKTHDVHLGDAALLVDIDLGILGAPPPAFEAYDRAIRLEYGWVPEEQYKIGRSLVLEGFLKRDVIYNTAELRNRLEAQARENLHRKLRELGAT